MKQRARFMPIVSMGLLLSAIASLTAQTPPPVRDLFKDVYNGYQPDFVRKIDQGTNLGGPYFRWKPGPEEMKLSSEPAFFTLTMVDEDSRANALVEAEAHFLPDEIGSSWNATYECLRTLPDYIRGLSNTYPYTIIDEVDFDDSTLSNIRDFLEEYRS